MAFKFYKVDDTEAQEAAEELGGAGPGGGTSEWGQSVLASNAQSNNTYDRSWLSDQIASEEALPTLVKDGDVRGSARQYRERLADNIGYTSPRTALDTGETTAPAPSSTSGGMKFYKPTEPEVEPEEPNWFAKTVSRPIMRGLINTGALIDVAQGDVEELAEGQKLLEKYAMTDDQLERMAKIQESDGFWEAMGGYITNPDLALGIVFESLPMSAAPLAGGAGGGAVGSLAGPVGTVAGTMSGAAAGSYATEYFNSIKEAFSENGVDLTDVEQLKAAFGNEQLMAAAREKGVKRGIPIATMDALSFGLAGRFYKTGEALADAAESTAGTIAAKTVGGTSEVVAQATLGAAGEAGAQISSEGEITSIADVAAEAIGEVVPGTLEAGINAALDAREPSSGGGTGPTPEGRTVPLPETDETGQPITPDDIAAEAEPFTVSEEDQAAIEATLDETEAAPQPESATPEQPTAVTSEAESVEQTETPESPAVAEPVSQQDVPTTGRPVEAEPDEAVQQVPDRTGEADPVENPMIVAKDVEKDFRDLENRSPTKDSVKPIRSGLRKLARTIKEAFPDADLPAFGGNSGAKRTGQFFAALDEQVVIDESLPNLKGLLAEIAASPDPATAVQNIDRLNSYIESTLTAAPEGTVQGSPEAQAGQAVAAYDLFESRRKAGEKIQKRKVTITDKETGKKIQKVSDVVTNRAPENKRPARTTAVDELATTVSEMMKTADQDTLNALPANVQRTINNVRRWREDVDKGGRVKSNKGGAETSSTTYIATKRGLDAASKVLREAADVLLGGQPTANEKVKAVADKKAQDRKGKKKAAKPKTVTEAVQQEAAPRTESDPAPAAPETVVEETQDAEVFEADTKLRITGTKARNVAQDITGETGVGINEAIERVGFKPETAGTLRSIVDAVPDKNKNDVREALDEYNRNRDPLLLVTRISQALEKQLSPDTAQNLLEWADTSATLAENRAADTDSTVEDLAMMEEIEEMTGFATVDLDPNAVDEDGAVEFGLDNWKDLQFQILDDKADDAAIDASLDEGTPLRKLMDRFRYDNEGENGRPVKLQAVLKAVTESLPESHRYHKLAKRLMDLNLQVPVYLTSAYRKIDQGLVGGSYNAGRNFDVKKRHLIAVFPTDNSGYTESKGLHSFLHEAVHAATVTGLQTNPEFREQVQELFDLADSYFDSMNMPRPYGMTNLDEFVAEGLTNSDFQSLLASMPYKQTGRIGTVLQSFIDSIKNVIGLPVKDSVLDNLLVVTDMNLQNELQVRASSYRLNQAGMSPRGTYGNILAPLKNLSKSQKGMRKGMVGAFGEGLNLGFSGRDQIERKYRGLFERAAKAAKMSRNPLHAYVELRNSASSLANKYAKKGHGLLKRFQTLDNTATTKLNEMMKAVTMGNVYANKSLRDPANDHLWGPPNKKGVRKLLPKYAKRAVEARAAYVQFAKEHPKAAALLWDLAAFTREVHEKKVSLLLRSLGKAYGFDSKTVRALENAKSPEDLDSVLPTAIPEIAGDKPTKEEAEAITKAKASAEANAAAKRIMKRSTMKGPYFPLRRYGNHVVSTGSDVDGEGAYFATFQTKKEALADMQKQKAAGRKVSYSLKVSNQAGPRDIQSAVNDIARKIKGGDTETGNPVRELFKAAAVEVLSDSIQYSSQNKRDNIEGVNPQDMGRALEEYLNVSKFSIGDLMVSHEVGETMQQMTDLQFNRDGELTDAGLTVDEVESIGMVVNEFKMRNRQEGGDRKVSGFQRLVGAIGFFNFLGAPSYWTLNMTQTYTVTMPYLLAKFGPRATAKLIKHQKNVLAAATKAGGKGYEAFKKNLPPETQAVVNMLEKQNILQSNVLNEFGDMLSPSWTRKVPVMSQALSMMETVPEAIEHFNRISTAMAAYEASGGSRQETIDAVQATQFNYDTGNRARLLKSLPGEEGGGRFIVSPIMMFKTYGIGMAKLLYGNLLKAAKREEGSAEAAKLAAGLIASHTAFGGVAGGMMLFPVQALIAVANELFWDEPDEEFDYRTGVEDFVESHTNEWVATLVGRGVPAALGADLSRSINLGNLIWMGNDRLEPAEFGSLEQSAFQLLGPVPQYATQSIREGYRLATNDPRGGWDEFLETAIPLKAAKGVVSAFKNEGEGIRTGSELALLEDPSFWGTTLTALGFQSTEKTTAAQKYYRDERVERKRQKRRQNLIANILKRAEQGKDFNDLLDDVESFNSSLATREARKSKITKGDIARLRSRRRQAQREYNRKYGK